MLEFYLIDDSQSKSNRHLDLKRAGDMEDDLFFQLQVEGIIEPWFDYYSNFRWGSEIVARVLLKLQQQPVAVSQKDRIDFIAVLQKAVDGKFGLLAFGD